MSRKHSHGKSDKRIKGLEEEGFKREINERENVEEEIQWNHEIQLVTNSLLRLSEGGISLDELLQSALDLILSDPRNGFEPRGSILLVEGNPEVLVLKAQKGLDVTVHEKCMHVPLGESMYKEAALTKRIQLIACTEESPTSPSHNIGTSGYYCVPILYAGGVLGIITIYVTEGSPRHPKEVEFLTSIANTLSAVILHKKAEEEKMRLEVQLRQAHKMEAIGTLAGGIAHDFNNILHTISGYTQMLLMKKEPSDSDYSMLKVIEQSAMKAGDLVKQLMIFGRKVESKFRPVDLNNEVEQITQILERTIPKMISMETHLSKSLNIIDADPGQLEQIIMNLGVNARDAMPDGGKLVFATENIILDSTYCIAHAGAKPGEYVVLSVSDTGHGMDSETLDHIYEPFYSTKGIGEGTGLGLAMVYGIVKSHGGYIMCYSEPGQGTTFRIYFPVIRRVAEVQGETAGGEEKIVGGSETILLVDDEKILLDIGTSILEGFGYKTITAENGERAIEIFKKGKDHIDLVILDVGMPGMGGHECLKRLHEFDPKLKVIIASGYAAHGRVKETIDAGAVDFIGKPYRLVDMVKKVRNALDQS